MIYPAEVVSGAGMARVGMVVFVLAAALGGCQPTVQSAKAPAAANPSAAKDADGAALQAAQDPDPNALAFASAKDGAACHGVSGEGGAPAPFSEEQRIGRTGRATRSGAQLRIGKALFTNKPFEVHEADGAEYAYLGRLAGTDLDVVEGRFYEWMTWTIVDPATGEKGVLSGPPIASPDRASFVALSDDAVGESYNGIDIVEYRDGRFHSQSIDGGFPCEARWVSPDAFEIRILPRGLGAGEQATSGAVEAGQVPLTEWKVIRVARGAEGWTLVPPAV